MGVEPKTGGVYPPKWIVYHGKPYEQMDDLGGFPPIFSTIHPKWLVSWGPPLGPPRPSGAWGIGVLSSRQLRDFKSLGLEYLGISILED